MATKTGINQQGGQGNQGNTGNAGNTGARRGYDEQHGARGSQLNANKTNGAKTGKKGKGE